VANLAEVSQRLLETRISGSDLGKRLRAAAFQEILGFGLVNVVLSMVRPELVGAVRSIAPQECDGTGFLPGVIFQSDREVFREIRILPDEYPKPMAAVLAFQDRLVPVASHLGSHASLRGFDGAFRTRKQLIEFVLAPSFHFQKLL